MISSIDGRLQIERYSDLHNSQNPNEALKIYLDLGKKIASDAWMIGGGTVVSMGITDVFSAENNLPAINLTSYAAEKRSDKFCVIFDSKGKIRFSKNTFEGDSIILVLGETVTQEYLNYLKELGISYLFAGNDGYDLELAMAKLNIDFGIKTIRLEGGGVLNGRFLNAGLINELSILLYPGIDGLSGISSIFEYKGSGKELPSKNQTLELKNVEKLAAGLLWLQYDVHHKESN